MNQGNLVIVAACASFACACAASVSRDEPHAGSAPPGMTEPALAPTGFAALSVPADEAIETCHTLRVHEREIGGDATPHVVEPGEHYSCFYFDVPWPIGAQALRVRTDAGPGAHHIELFHVDTTQPDGAILRQQPHCGLSTSAPLAIWGSGQRSEQSAPAGVGLALPAPSNAGRLRMDVHYLNPWGHAVTDISRVEVCTANTPQPRVADIAMLGAPSFTLQPGQTALVSGTCTPTHAGDIHLWRTFPHMHARGRAFESLVERADGSVESILRVAYDVTDQRTYELDVVLHPGDRLLSRCDYVNDTDRVIGAGFTSDDEMCVQFVYAWPAAALTNGALGLPGTCLR